MTDLWVMLDPIAPSVCEIVIKGIFWVLQDAYTINISIKDPKMLYRAMKLSNNHMDISSTPLDIFSILLSCNL